METLDLILFLIILIILIIVGYYLYKGLSIFGSWLGGGLGDISKKLSDMWQGYQQWREESGQLYTKTQNNLICLISGTCTVADVIKEQEQTQKVIIPPVNRYYYTTEVK